MPMHWFHYILLCTCNYLTLIVKWNHSYFVSSNVCLVLMVQRKRYVWRLFLTFPKKVKSYCLLTMKRGYQSPTCSIMVVWKTARLLQFFIGKKWTEKHGVWRYLINYFVLKHTFKFFTTLQSCQVDLLAKIEISNGTAVACDVAGVTPVGGSGGMHSVGSVLSWRVLRKWRQASIPSLWGMLVYSEETSRVTRMALSGSGPICSSWRRKCAVSLM